MAYRMARLPMTLNEFEGHFWYLEYQSLSQLAVPLHLQSFL